MEAAFLLEDGYKKIIEAIGIMGYPVKTDDNFAETSGRAARAMLELLRPVDEITAEIDQMLARTFTARYDEMVISKHNICFGMCPHHLLPVIYRISVAYLPARRCSGISKLSRLVQICRARPVLQEDLTHELAEILSSRLGAAARPPTSRACTCAWRRAA